MSTVFRVLDPIPCASLSAYMTSGGGEALRLAKESDPASIVDAIDRSGLRGRGGAGFPTAVKWRGILANASSKTPTSVVINGAEGEPSTFKDRTILRNNPYRVLEGALVACEVIGAPDLVICLKYAFSTEWDRIVAALQELTLAGWLDGIHVRLVAGPDAYLFGEETALLEVAANRQPFPRVTPPWRRGVESDPGGDVGSATAELATPGDSGGAPALVNNVETFANIALIVLYGPDWFREVGTAESPGTVVCTVVGDVVRHGVGEYAMGTTLRTVIDDLGGGAGPGRRIVGVLPGVSSAVIGEAFLDTPLSHEGLKAAGSALGSAGFHCIDDEADVFGITFSAARFLAIESCGQCSPCKEDGLAVTSLLRGLLDGTAADNVEADIQRRLSTVVNQARCSLAQQQQVVTGSLVAMCAASAPGWGAGAPVAAGAVATDAEPGAVRGGSDGGTADAVLPLLDIVDGAAVYDREHLRKQPDWSHDPVDSGTFPAQRLQDVAVDNDPPLVSEPGRRPAAVSG